MNYQKGQAAILIIFVLGMVSLLIGISLVKTGFAESIMGRSTADSTQAFYAANSGVEDALYRVIPLTYSFKTCDSPHDTYDNYKLNLDDSSTDVSICGTSEELNIESAGTYKNYVRKIKVTAIKNSSTPGFENAIFAGFGGLDLNGATVSNLVEGEDANIFSKSYVVGKSDICNDNSSGATVKGDATAVISISDVCVQGDVYAPDIKNIGVGVPHVSSPIDRDFPDIGIGLTQSYLEEVAIDPYSGDCIITKHGVPSDCDNQFNGVMENVIINDGDLTVEGSLRIGNVIINDGDLTIEGNLEISGPVWVKGNIIINNKNNLISLADETSNRLVIADGTIDVKPSSVFKTYDKVFLLWASTFKEDGYDVYPPTRVCDDKETHAVLVGANVESVFFYANNGCISVTNPTASKQITGAIFGKAVYLKNTTLQYNSNLAKAEFIPPDENNFVVASFKEY